MAQTQKYEKIAIFGSNLDKDVNPNNRSTNFVNRVFPIQQYQEYDAIVPMMATVPTAQSYLTIKQSYIDIIQKYMKPQPLIDVQLNFKDAEGNSELYDFQIFLFVDIILPLTFEFQIPVQYPERFFEPVFCLVPKKDQDFSCFFFNYTEDNIRYLTVTLKQDLNTHKTRILDKDQTLEFFIQTEFANWDLYLASDEETLLPSDIDEKTSFYDNWSKEDRDTARERWTKDDSHTLDYFQPLALHIKNPHITLPSDFYTRHGSGEKEDDEQIYIHNSKIQFTRIANQNEPIYQDIFLDENKIKLSRMTDYISTPMHLALDLNSSLLSEMDFEFLNGVGEENNNIDKNRPSFILCKFIKKYYDFSDGKKKINLPESI
ncbi:MAG: hypothetical protein ACRDDH_00070 [Cetobacterium sp.]|uniref:hypothetical protein n=1 Tax=Cetobacterium sp. TaxID=2071632 RepID=UPI003EE5804A